MELMTVREAADYLRVAPVTVRRYIAAGTLRGLRVGRQVRIDKEELERLLTPAIPKRNTAIPRGRPPAKDNPLWRIAGRGTHRDGAIISADPEPELKPFTFDDPLWDIVGMGASTQPDGITDVSLNKHKYLAEAYADLHEEKPRSKGQKSRRGRD
jgi:excisionase family DNA binding protein